MLYTKLPVPIFLNTQLAAMATERHTYEELIRLAQGSYRILLRDGEAAVETCSVVNGDESISFIPEKSGNKYIYGAEAIRHLFPDAKPLTELDVPGDVFAKCSTREWIDICRSFRSVECRANRLKQLKDMNCPTVILVNEARILFEKVMALEHNNIYGGAYHVYDENKRVLRSLNDVGYSLVFGWLVKKETKNGENCDG